MRWAGESVRAASGHARGLQEGLSRAGDDGLAGLASIYKATGCCSVSKDRHLCTPDAAITEAEREGGGAVSVSYRRRWRAVEVAGRRWNGDDRSSIEISNCGRDSSIGLAASLSMRGVSALLPLGSGMQKHILWMIANHCARVTCSERLLLLELRLLFQWRATAGSFGS